MTDTGMKVWRDATQAWDDCIDLTEYTSADEAAAAVITAAMAEDKARIAELTLERDGARKAMDLFLGAPGMPPEVLQWVHLQMSGEARNVTDA